jgi:hypothetical protein
MRKAIVHGMLLEKVHEEREKGEREEGRIVFQRCGLLMFFDEGLGDGAMEGLIERILEGGIDSGESLGGMEGDEKGGYSVTVV